MEFQYVRLVFASRLAAVMTPPQKAQVFVASSCRSNFVSLGDSPSCIEHLFPPASSRTRETFIQYISQAFQKTYQCCHRCSTESLHFNAGFVMCFYKACYFEISESFRVCKQVTLSTKMKDKKRPIKDKEILKSPVKHLAFKTTAN